MFRAQTRFYVNARAIIERQGDHGPEVLMQRRTKPGEPRTLELPGGQLDPFEGITEALAREVREETGLTVTAFLDDLHHSRTPTATTEVECLTPAFVYQTLRGPVDSVGFFFRVQAQGTLARQGDHADRHEWLTQAALRHLFAHTWKAA